MAWPLVEEPLFCGFPYCNELTDDAIESIFTNNNSAPLNKGLYRTRQYNNISSSVVDPFYFDPDPRIRFVK